MEPLQTVTHTVVSLSLKELVLIVSAIIGGYITIAGLYYKLKLHSEILEKELHMLREQFKNFEDRVEKKLDSLIEGRGRG